MLLTHAMVLAAGRGSRMRPLTDHIPKPLLPVAGRTMLDRALDHLVPLQLRRVVVNCHHHADQLRAHLATRTDLPITLSPEADLLDTGGGVAQALSLLGDEPFLVLNADLPWRDGADPALLRLARGWNDAQMDCLMLLMPTAAAHGFGPQGDFFMRADGQLYRAGTLPPRPLVWISAMLVHPRAYRACPPPPFSNNWIWHRAEAAGRLYGLLHQGQAWHAGTPEDLAKADRLIRAAEQDMMPHTSGLPAAI